MSLLARRSSTNLLDSIQNELDALLSDSRLNNNGTWTPAVDIQSKDDNYIIHADLPGVNPNDINITIDSNVLTIQGERYTENRDRKNGYSMIERCAGKFFRQFTLPNNIAQEDILAEVDNGMLKLTIPRQKQAVKKIAIQTKANVHDRVNNKVTAKEEVEA